MLCFILCVRHAVSQVDDNAFSWKKRKATRCCSFVTLGALIKLAVAALNCGDEGMKVSSVTRVPTQVLKGLKRS